MAVYGRHSVLGGEAVTLRVIFTDDAGNLVDTDALPVVYIYDSSVDTDTIDQEIIDALYSSALAGPLAPTRISTGFYELSYTVPAGGPEGLWHDLWVGAVGGVDSTSYLNFTVDLAADLSVQSLGDNELILVCLDADIANTDGTATLGAEQTLSFSTTYNPLYASPDLLRMEIGTFIDYIPDDTLALMIHWSSKEADFITGKMPCNSADYAFARTKFVIFDAALRALSLPAGSDGSGSSATSASGTKKSLGDLLIDKSGGGASVATTSGGVDVYTLDYIRGMRDEWWRVVNAGACIVPGQGLSPETAIRGKFNPDRRADGRLWANPEYTSYPVPTANTKYKFPGHQRGRWGYTDWRRHSHLSQRRTSKPLRKSYT